VTNYDLEKIVDTSNEWIIQRSGIRERRQAVEGESTLTFALEASLAALEEAKVRPEDVDMIIVGTQTPDMILPSTACLLQAKLGAPKAQPFDLKAGCTGWVYSLVVADRFVRVNPDYKILVVGAEILSRFTNWEDRSTCVLLGDAAGAVLVSGSRDGSGILSTGLKADGSKWESLCMPGGGTMHPWDYELIDKKLYTLHMEGSKVFKLAVPAMEEMAWSVLKEAGYKVEDVDWFVPHQANIRIMNLVAQRMGIPKEKIIVTIDKYGNTSTACIPVALAESTREGKIKRGDLVLMVSFGGGFTWGGVLMRW
jgi:3-oxoacyl-[acyl-carrier-protein] synthase-3